MQSRPASSADDAWQRFHDEAREYCSVVESVSDYPDADSFYATIAAPLANLYAAGLELPDVSPTGDDVEVATLGHEAWMAVFRAINDVTGDGDPYRTVIDPHEDTDAVEAALGQDLADIYCDVLPATTWTDVEHLADLQWEMRFQFQGHWGRHALEAMRAIHWRRGYW